VRIYTQIHVKGPDRQRSNVRCAANTLPSTAPESSVAAEPERDSINNYLPFHAPRSRARSSDYIYKRNCDINSTPEFYCIMNFRDWYLGPHCLQRCPLRSIPRPSSERREGVGKACDGQGGQDAVSAWLSEKNAGGEGETQGKPQPPTEEPQKEEDHPPLHERTRSNRAHGVQRGAFRGCRGHALAAVIHWQEQGRPRWSVHTHASCG
jgi:hypothetical protein